LADGRATGHSDPEPKKDVKRRPERLATDPTPLKVAGRFEFDLGTNSVGWAVYRLDGAPGAKSPPRTIVELLGCGVRLFDDGRNPKDGRSLAEMRHIPAH